MIRWWYPQRMEWQEERPVQERPGAAPNRSVSSRHLLLGVSVLLVAAALLAGLLWMNDESDSPANTGDSNVEAPVFDPRQTNLLQPPTTTSAAATPTMDIISAFPTDIPLLPTETPPVASAECNSFCLVRLQNSETTVSAIGALGVPLGYAYGATIWTGVTGDDLASLESGLTGVEVLSNAIDTASLYIIRVPNGGDAALIKEYGEIIDEQGDQYLMSIPGPPAYVLELVDQDVAIEKLPPLTGPPPQTFGGLGQIPDPWTLSSEVSAAQLQRRIEDLQGIGDENGDGLGTRHYGTAANVEAAEYLYRRLASYGLEVRYEDFVGDHGRLLTNVVGTIPGRDPSQPIVLTAHFDTISQEISDPQQSPGALDNGSGVAVLLEVARILAQYDLEHPVDIVFLNAEEYALQGAEAFANRLQSSGRFYTAGFNVDSVGAALSTNQLYVNADSSSLFLQTLLIDLNDALGLGISIIPMVSAKVIADDTMLTNVGVPIVMVAAVLYGDPMINISTDTIAQIDLGYETTVAQLIVAATASLAMGEA